MKIRDNLFKKPCIKDIIPSRWKFVIIFTTLILFYTLDLFPKNFYFSSSYGNDSYTAIQAQNPSTPWKSIDQLNRSMNLIYPGDSILFKRGDTFIGQISLTRSGTAGARIVFSAYGTGYLPIIKGTLPVRAWTRYGTNIWQSDCPQLGSNVTNFFIDGKSQQIGRYPNADDKNKGYLKVDAHIGSYQLTSSSLSSSPNWTGGDAVIRTTRWYLDRVPIQSHRGYTLVFGSETAFSIQDNYGFFIQNHLGTLDQAGEWYFDALNKKMYLFYLSDPNFLNTEATTFSSVFAANSVKYFSIENIEIKGSLTSNIKIDNSSNIEINNNIISESGINAINSWGSNNINLTNNKILSSNDDALVFLTCSNIVINRNIILRTGLRAGMGTNYICLNFVGSNLRCESNFIDSVGYHGICFGTNDILIRNNHIGHFCMTVDDGGGLYTGGDGNVSSNRIFENNIIIDGIGAGDGTDYPEYSLANGIYLDDMTDHVNISGNTVANCTGYGIYGHNSNNLSLNNNTVYNNSAQIAFIHDYIASDFPIRNCSLKNNIFVSKSAEEYVAYFTTIRNDISQFGSFDYNYYCRPIDDNLIFCTKQANSGEIKRTLSGWQLYSGQDANSNKSPITISNENKLRFEYNAANSPKVIYLEVGYIDVKGTKYSGSLTLMPYTSVVLIEDPNSSVPPASPVCTSSLIENSDPSQLEMTFTLTLTNIVPSASAFTVIVNSVARSINKVSISGNKVLLTLSSPVVYGDVVTIAYTKPSTNPLQTSYGGEAASLSAQPVTNNVSPTYPVYLRSCVENTTPYILEMNYNLILADVAPAASAFTVMVNSAFRIVSTVAISGTKVLLTLSNPVIYGDVVTVAYTKPSTNPLKTPIGGEAASLGAQPVVNRVSLAVPVYISSVIENISPLNLEINYNMSLTNSVPSVTAFTVRVGSVLRTVNSVTISGTKVILTLANPIIFGDIVTISYTKPANNPIKSTSGGEASSFSAQTVTNNVLFVNTPPVIVVNYSLSNSSCFVGEIDASGSYDANGDNLTFKWIAPGNIPVTATSGSKIKFLCPEIDKSKTVEFTLTISDGKITQSKIIPLEILPYKPELETAEIIKVEASDFQYPNFPFNILDSNIGTMWASNGDNQWLVLSLKEPFKIDHVKISFQLGQRKESYFDIFASMDNITWNPILMKSSSCGFSGNPQVFDFPVSQTKTEYPFIKLVGHSNSVDTWNYISEFKLYGHSVHTLINKDQPKITIYPNPVHEYINISIKKEALIPDFIRISNLLGAVVYENKIDPDVEEFQIPIDFNSGIYIVQIDSDDILCFTQKLVVAR